MPDENRLPQLVLLPGLDGTEILFGPLLGALPSGLTPRIVTFPLDGPHDYTELLPIVAQAVASIGDFYVLGWSFSGPLALMLARHLPDRVRGIILAASFVRLPLPHLARLRFAVTGPAVAVVRAIRRSPLVLFGAGTPQFREAKRRTWARINSNVLAARARSVFDVDARELLRDCRQPLLYIAGTEDTVVPFHNAAEIAKEQPQTQVVRIAGPHLALFTNPMAAADEIAGFIARQKRNA